MGIKVVLKEGQLEYKVVTNLGFYVVVARFLQEN